MAKKAYIGVGNFVKRNLPNGYTQVEYIESNGTQWIDTGFKPNQNTKIVFKVGATNGNFYAAISNSPRLGLYLLSSGRIDFAYNTINYTGGVLTGVTMPATIVVQNGTLTANGKTYTFTTQSNFNCTSTLPLFAEGSTASPSGTLYSCQIYDNGTLVRDFVPCKNPSGVIGLYDMVNEAFYQNVGSGAFVAGTSLYSSVARKIKKGYIGISEMTNLVPTPSAWSLSNVTVSDEVFTFSAGTTAMAQCSMSIPTAGHKYYGRVMFKSPSGFSCPDGRYEYFHTDGQNIVFHTGVGNVTNDAWVMQSSILSFSSVTATSFQMRNFIVSGNAVVYRKEPMVIDLTEAFGAGNEPTKEWCDANIPYFVGVRAFEASGLSSVARLIKKAYIGIGGVARPCWSAGELTYYGAVTGLVEGRDWLAATTVGNYALFGGGYSESIEGAYSRVDAYSASLTRTTPSNLIVERHMLCATTVGNYAIFGNGHTGTGFTTSTTSYDTSLTRKSISASACHCSGAATTIGNYALFAGGENSTDYVNVVEAYDTSLTRSTPTAMSVKRKEFAGTTVGNYAIFAGGMAGEYYSSAEAYDANLTRVTPASMSDTLWMHAGASVGNYALFGPYANRVEVYDANLTRLNALSITGGYSAPATSIGNYAIFGPGTNRWTAVDSFDASLTKTAMPALSVERTRGAATTVGNYALFGGGCDRGYNNSLTNVDAYTIA